VISLGDDGEASLIGVVPKAGQAAVVEEFFELFKTPWEFYRPGRAYEVVIVTADEAPDIKPKLLLVYHATSIDLDRRMGIDARERHRGGTLSYRDVFLPIYNDLLSFDGGTNGIDPLVSSSGPVGVTLENPPYTVIRLGYDLFEEIRLLLSAGQPVEHAHIPTLDLHIKMLREWILEAGIPLLEIPPAPSGHAFSVSLTHDIDFIGIRNHKFDHSMWGFVYRATAGSFRNFCRGRTSVRRVLQNWSAVASLPFVYAGWVKDFWEPFEWYLEVEKGVPATYFLIPFKRRSGEKVPGPRASLRAAAYDVGDLSHWTAILLNRGCELGVHGIDAWHSPKKAREELAKIASVTGNPETGIRMHWLLRNENTPLTLEQAGYAYDSTVGYNETIGYRAGTGQVFRPLGAQTILELPLHIQDGALFYPQKLDLIDSEARKRCQSMIDNANENGGVLTVLWHDRSHGPERFWGSFYMSLVQELKATNAWFATGAQLVGWFRKRRSVRFEYRESRDTRPHLLYEGPEIQPPVRIRVYKPKARQVATALEPATKFYEVPWNGKSVELQIAFLFSAVLQEDALSLPS
jgi:hypothetical protein